MEKKASPRKDARRRPASEPTASEPRMHQITFCTSCTEAIPAHAAVCFRCGAGQPNGEKALQVVFCKRCQKDYPARAMACHHCGHLNPRHPYLRGHIAS